jgi:two-component system cell cycle sensor histidine kinase/response regulator CckA
MPPFDPTSDRVPFTAAPNTSAQAHAHARSEEDSAFQEMPGHATDRDAGSALRASEGRFRAMFEGSPIGMALLDLTGRYIAVNPSLQSMLGYASADLVGQLVWEQYPDKSSVAPLARLETLLSGEMESYRREQPYVRCDGKEIFAQVTAALLRDESGDPECGLCMVEDITERKQLEARLRQAQKMEAVGRFAGGIAHDFNNTLSTITAYAQILFDDLAASGELRADAGEILKAASRAAGLTRQLLTFSRTKVLDYELLDVCVVVEEFEALLRPLLPASIDLVIRPTCKSATVHADRTQLEQVLMNLALNARDAMSSGGTLAIEVSQHAAKGLPSTLLQPHGSAAGYAVLSVTDSGTGISEADRLRLFEPFFTTKGEAQGTGLGLATVYAIVRQAGGTVAVDSRPGSGSCFTVTLPLACGPAPDAATQGQTCTLVPHEERTTVLIAEDEPSVREAARRLLHRAGMRVITACDGVEALAVLREESHVDVLMTDVIMPNMGGFELIERASMVRPGLRVIVVSGHADVGESDPRGLGDVVLEKPFSADSLIRAVRSAVAPGATEVV